MSDILFSLNITVPVFMLMIIGMVFKKIGWISDEFAKSMNKFVFLFPLPVSVFKSMATASFKEDMDFKFVLFCALTTLTMIIIGMILAKLFVRRELWGEFIQACFRSNIALLGMSLVSSVYPNSVYGPLMLLGCMPVYNTLAVVILTVFSPDTVGFEKGTGKKVLIGIAKNPIIIALVLGIAWSFLEIPYPDMLSKTVTYMANLATPMGLMALGATFEVKEAIGDLKPALLASFMRVIGFCILFIPIAVLFGYRGDAILSYTIMLGASQAIASYTMAKNMGHRAVLTSTSLMLTTLLCGFTLTFWIYLLKVMTLI